MSIAAFLGPTLRGHAADARAALPRIADAEDPEGVHDFRVALRRLRSLLRPARAVYGRFHTDAVRAHLRAVADATGALRDEEVLAETVGELALPVAAARQRDAWLGRRAIQKRALRGALVRRVRSGEVDRALALLDALLLLPVRPDRDVDPNAFAASVVAKAESDVLRSLGAADPEALHALRILFKRLRYALESFAGLLPPDASERARKAARFQKILGEIHDVDVAVLTVSRARALPAPARGRVLTALAARRVVYMGRLDVERGVLESP